MPSMASIGPREECIAFIELVNRSRYVGYELRTIFLCRAHEARRWPFWFAKEDR